jgi:hypothetical protein
MQMPNIAAVRLAEDVELSNAFTAKTSASTAILSSAFLHALYRMRVGQLAAMYLPFAFLRS